MFEWEGASNASSFPGFLSPLNKVDNSIGTVLLLLIFCCLLLWRFLVRVSTFGASRPCSKRDEKKRLFSLLLSRIGACVYYLFRYLCRPYQPRHSWQDTSPCLLCVNNRKWTTSCHLPIAVISIYFSLVFLNDPPKLLKNQCCLCVNEGEVESGLMNGTNWEQRTTE